VNYAHYGRRHGTAMFLDASKPDAEAFLAHMESWLPPDEVEAYTDAFIDARMGDHVDEFPYLAALSKVGSEEEG